MVRLSVSKMDFRQRRIYSNDISLRQTLAAVMVYAYMNKGLNKFEQTHHFARIVRVISPYYNAKAFTHIIPFCLF